MIVMEKVMLDSAKAVNEFVHLNSQTKLNVDVGEGRYIVNGRSVMGVFSLNLSKPVNVRVESDDEGLIRRYFESINRFIVPFSV